MDNLGILIPIVAIVLPITAWIVSRVLAHNEYMAMINHGITPPPDSRAWRRMQRQGWAPPPGPPGTNAWGGPPPPPPPGFSTIPPAPSYNQYSDYYHVWAQRRLGRGITVAMVGVALYLGLGFLDGRHGFGGPALPGLILMFVGFAQVISAVLAGATVGGPSVQVGGPRPGNPNAAPFGPPPSQPQPPPPPEGNPPYGWRPGSTVEIERPAGPPDNR